ncbi:MAG: 30S ribosomal protein S6 [Patescibacteria group bacterium]
MYYELLFIISPVVPETEQARVTQAVGQYLKTIGASVANDFYPLGRRKLAYPIKKQKHGFYVFVDFSLAEDKGGLKQLETSLKHNNDILRHLVIAKSKPAASADLARLQAANKPEAVVRSRTIRKPISRVSRPRATMKPVAAPVSEISHRPAISLDDIDKKLDEILTNDPKLE